MIEENTYLYFYQYTSDTNFRWVNLLSGKYAKLSNVKLNELEGIIFTEKEITGTDLRFPITQEDEILKKYVGRKIEFN
ncbi:MAG: hypothetical protein PHD81_01785 [Candidatus Nanoarchaeia archaeon]|nr:hypothetical protein [Candidatus Nanoarchaeia archaeon]MDD5587820.1 hypothetical protein [Candidatus Nanoarchaeia archaeon]